MYIWHHVVLNRSGKSRNLKKKVTQLLSFRASGNYSSHLLNRTIRIAKCLNRYWKLLERKHFRVFELRSTRQYLIIAERGLIQWKQLITRCEFLARTTSYLGRMHSNGSSLIEYQYRVQLELHSVLNRHRESKIQASHLTDSRRLLAVLAAEKSSQLTWERKPEFGRVWQGSASIRWRKKCS